MDKMPFDSAQFRFQYKQALGSGEYMEGVYNCYVCGHGGITLMIASAAKEVECAECGSQDVTRSMVQLNG